MIFTAIISVIATVLAGIIQLLPVADPATVTFIGSQLASFKSNLAGVDWIFPLGTFFSVIGMVFATEATLVIIKVTIWIAKNVSAGFVK